MKRVVALVVALAVAVVVCAQGPQPSPPFAYQLRTIYGAGSPTANSVPCSPLANDRMFYIDSGALGLYFCSSRSGAYQWDLIPTNGSTSGGSSTPVFAPTALTAFGDSLSTGANGITLPSNAYVNHLAADLNITAPINRAFTGDEAADQVFRFLNADNPAVTATPTLYTDMIGTNDANQNGVGPSTWEANYKLFHQAFLAWVGIPSGKIAGSTATTTGTCTTDSTFPFVTGEKCTANASTQTFSSVVSTGKPIYVWYRVISADTGTFTYTVDGGSPVTVTTAPPIAFTTVNSHTSSMGLIRVSGMAAGTHSVVFTQTASGTMSILAVGSLQSIPISGLPTVVVGGVPNQLNQNLLAATSTYDADAQADITLLASDGLNILFAPVSAAIQATTAAADMFDVLHMNDVGDIEAYRAFKTPVRITIAFTMPWLYSSASNGAASVNVAAITIGGSNNAPAVNYSANFGNTAASGGGSGALNVFGGSGGNITMGWNVDGAQKWVWGLFPGGLGTGSTMLLRDVVGAKNIFVIPSNTMPANSYGGNAAGPILLVVQTPAARKGTFVCTAAGTITIANVNYIATSDVSITMNTAGGTITTPPAFKTVTPTTGFSVLCGATDTSTYNYNILN